MYIRDRNSVGNALSLEANEFALYPPAENSSGNLSEASSSILVRCKCAPLSRFVSQSGQRVTQNFCANCPTGNQKPKCFLPVTPQQVPGLMGKGTPIWVRCLNEGSQLRFPSGVKIIPGFRQIWPNETLPQAILRICGDPSLFGGYYLEVRCSEVGPQ